MNPASGEAMAQTVIRTTFEWGRIQSNADWVLPVAACVAILLFVRWMYRRDAEELHPAVGWLLTVLRTAVFFGLLVLYLQPRWRTEREETVPSRVAVLVDTSLSMGLTDVVPKAGTAPVSRCQAAAAALARNDLLNALRKRHDVVVARFDADLNRVASLKKRGSESPEPSVAPAEKPGGPSSQATPAQRPMNWQETLRPVGLETRLGYAIEQLLQGEDTSTLAGIVLLTDGAQNSGLTPDAALDRSGEAKVAIFPVGLGSAKQELAGVRVADFAAPARAYPGDRYTVTGYIQAEKMAGRTVTVELFSRDAPTGSGAAADPGQREASQAVTLGADGEVVPVKFTLVPTEVGRKLLTLRVQPVADDNHPGDNHQEADVEIVDHKNRILLLAGGPNREYQFLRNLLYRDKTTQTDILLQTGQPGMSQEASEILDDFPATREELFGYDCIVAFDPDWQTLGPEQIALLETWVAEQGGGLIAIAGPVNAGKSINGWVQDPALGRLRALYPVEFQRRLASVETLPYGSETPWPLEFTREGIEAEYLWLGDTESASQAVWETFPGLYGYFPVRGAKQGATVYARFSDPRTAQSGELPVLLAGQFYGSGRVFYLGSGEFWRLRALDESYFEQLYTKLIRNVSQGRLLRGSSRGVLLVGQDRCLLGNTVDVRAQLTGARLEPLDAPRVDLQIIRPDGSVGSVPLRPDSTRAGTFAGQFPVLQEGTYRLELPIPESGDQRLTHRIQVRMPDLERTNPQRNDALLSEIAKRTGGVYYVGIDAAMEGKPSSLVGKLPDRTKTIIRPASPNLRHERQWMQWLMVGLVAFLSLEWLIRRIVKLA